MNNKGQSLVLFIAIIPIIFILCIFAIDLAKLSSEKTKIEGICDESISAIVENNKSSIEVENLVLLNDKDIKITDIGNDYICLEKEVEPIFGGIINLDIFKIKVCKEGYIENNKLVIKEKGN